jgi:hypothetical protein
MPRLSSVPRWLALVAALAALVTVTSGHAYAQGSPVPPPASPASDEQIELNLVSLPTTRSIGRHRSYFRLTHRFARDLGFGDFGDLAADLFSLDNGAIIGLEYRFGVTDTLHAGLHRNTLSKTLQVFGRWDALRQGGLLPVGLSVLGSIEGLDNLQEGRQPAIGLVASYTRGRAVALYASPMFVDGTLDAERLGAGDPGHDHDHIVPAADLGSAHDEDDHSGHDGTFFLGLGARVRLLPTVFLAGEISPRLAGHDPGDAGWGIALEKWTGGHTLALTLTNTFGTTPGQIARGGSDVIYLGFNITRKF